MAIHSPFDPDKESDYRLWRATKLDNSPTDPSDLRLYLSSVSGPDESEQAFIRDCCRRANLALISLAEGWERSGEGLRRLGARLGLEHLDQNLCADEQSISAIEARDRGRANEYIPYTDRPLSWHTDGYYNAPQQQVRAWSLLCVRPAAAGGDNQLLDPEIAYILLRDHDPALIRGLMQPDAMTIPPNIEDGKEIRPAVSGAVFSIARDGSLHMRYSARQRNIVWKPGAAAAAAEFLRDLFSSGSPHILRHRLQPGEVLLSNNVLHNRSGFRDTDRLGQGRLLYRARYLDRIPGTARTRS